MKRIGIVLTIIFSMLFYSKAVISAEIEIDKKEHTTQAFGLSFTFGEQLTCSIEDNNRSIVFHFPNNTPAGLIGVTLGHPLTYEEFKQGINEDETYHPDKFQIFKKGSDLIAHAVATGVHDPFEIYTFCFLNRGILVHYIGPPQNYHLFKSTMDSILFDN